MTCEICEKQPRGRHAQPLPCMNSSPNKQPISARYHGRGLDEAFYICSECGHEWVKESGPDGMGWQS